MLPNLRLRDRRRLRRQHRAHHLRHGEDADQRRDRLDAAEQVGDAEGEARHAARVLDADAGDQQAENMPAIAFTGEERATSVAHIRPRKRQPEIFEGRERQRDLGERRRQDHQRERAGDAADGGEPDAGAEREFGLALARHGVGFVGIGRGGGRAGDAQQRAGNVAGEDRHRGGRHDGGDRGDRREIEGDRDQQRRRHGRGQARAASR